MNDRNKAVRAYLRNVAPRKAKELLDYAELVEQEKQIIIAIDIEKRGIGYTADCIAHLSERQTNRIHNNALSKLAEYID